MSAVSFATFRTTAFHIFFQFLSHKNEQKKKQGRCGSNCFYLLWRERNYLSMVINFKQIKTVGIVGKPLCCEKE